jgi:hypothetical protein
MFNVYKNQLSWQTGSRNLTCPKTFPTIWHTYMKLVTKYQIPVINSCLEKCDEKCAYTTVCSMCIKINKIGKQEVGIWWVQKRFPRYGVTIWSLWPNIRFLPSIVTEKNEHICSDLVGFYTHWTYMYMHTFCHIFLSKYWWHESDIWSQASYWYPMSWEAFLDPSDSYFLFADFVDF